MKTAATLAFSSCLSILSFAAPVANANSVSDEAILGGWIFEADTGSACTFSGNMTLQSQKPDGSYDCELTARQDCINITFVVRQSCSAVRDGDTLTIVSQIEEFLEGPVTTAYWPDNFTLDIISGSFMTGTLLSHGTHLTDFRRPEGQLS